MLQQIIALLIILFFLFRLIHQKSRQKINGAEFILWLVFWLLAAAAIIFLKQIDQLVARLGFSGSGIDVLFYVAIIVLFYLIFRIRLHLVRMEKNITKIVRALALGANAKEDNHTKK